MEYILPTTSEQFYFCAPKTNQQALALFCMRAENYRQNRLYDLEANDLRCALLLDSTDQNIHAALLKAIIDVNSPWQMVEGIKNYLIVEPNNGELYGLLGQTYLKLKRFSEAKECFKAAHRLGPNGQVDYLYQIGYALEKMGRFHLSRKFYSLAVAGQPGLAWEQRLGIGLYHQRYRRWQDAAKAYELSLKTDPHNRKLLYSLGMAQVNCYDLSKAGDAFKAALTSNETAPGDGPQSAGQIILPGKGSFSQSLTVTEDEDCRMRLAMILEREERYSEAEKILRHLISISDGRNRYYASYRLGWILDLQGRYVEACDAFWGSMDNAELMLNPTPASAHLDHPDLTDPAFHFNAGLLHELASDFARAAESFKMAVDRQAEHTPVYTYRLGCALMKLGCYKEACEAFKDSRSLYKFPYLLGFDDNTPKHIILRSKYLEAMRSLAVQDRVIFYESLHGWGVHDSPYSIFKYLIDHPQYQGYLHVWSLNDKSMMPAQYFKREDVVIVPRLSYGFYRYLATAKYLIHNVSWPHEFIRRPEQRYLNTWHGTMIKKIGKDRPVPEYPLMDTYTNPGRNFIHATHFACSNEHTLRTFLSSYEVEGICSGLQAVTGNPRNDLLINADKDELAALRKKFGLLNDLPTITYAPTWRSSSNTVGTSYFDLNHLMDVYNQTCQLPCQFIFKGHINSSKHYQGQDMPFKVIPNHADTTEMLACTDVLITDYSSILFDFLPTRKPIILYLYDYDLYKTRQGLYFDMEGLPGSLCFTPAELHAALKKMLEGCFSPDHKYTAALEKYCSREDGRASKRTVEFFFEDNQECVINSRSVGSQRVLIAPGQLESDGRTRAFQHFLHNTDFKEKNVTLLLAPQLMDGREACLHNFNDLPHESVQVVGRKGYRVVSPEEYHLEKTYNWQYDATPNELMKKIRKDIYSLEFKRLFGPVEFDQVIDFDGCDPYTTELLAAAPSRAIKKTFLHGDMIREQSELTISLERHFKILYHDYDCLVSFGSGLKTLNQEKLGARYGLKAEKFFHQDFQLSQQLLMDKASEPLPGFISDFIGNNRALVSFGPLRPDLCHDVLIEAFAGLCQKHDDVRLIIAGDGPLRPKLLDLAENKFKLPHKIMLADKILNPYPLLKKAFCFTFPANYDTACVSVVEALVLGCKVLATNLVSTRDIFGNYSGMLLDNNAALWAEALNEICEFDD